MKKILTVIIMIFILVLPACSDNRSSERFRADSRSSSSASSQSGEETAKEKEAGKVFVYVCGEVIRPGVYELTSGSRVKDAIDLAGGLSADADMAGINQASRVKDQDKIVVPAKNSGEGASATSGGLLDINRATKEQLMTLPGIGESKAMAIISYREKTGGFKSIEEIQKIEGIKSGVFNKIKDSISVS